MPCKPSFRCNQTDEFLFVEIRVPWVRVSNMEFVVDRCEFSFFCRPYLLKLSFPGELIEDERCKAVYDPKKDHGTVTVHLPKQKRGEHFPDLDLITKLSAPSSRKSLKHAMKYRPLIEVVKSTSVEEINSNEESDSDASVGTDKDINIEKPSNDKLNHDETQHQEDRLPVGVLRKSVKYGFNDGWEHFFRPLLSEFPELIRVPDPDNTPARERIQLQADEEASAFDPFRFMSDFLTAEEDPMFYSFRSSSTFQWVQNMSVNVKTKSSTYDNSKDNISSSSVSSNPTTATSASASAIFTSTSTSSAITYENTKNDMSNDMSKEQTSTINGECNDEADNCTLMNPPCHHTEAAVSTAMMSENSENQTITPFSFTEMELQTMRDIPNEEYIVDPDSKNAQILLCGVLDIVAAFCYDCRMTSGDSNCQSGWTISTLSSTLSWLRTFETPYETLETLAQRIMIFPYVRLWQCWTLVFEDVCNIFAAGRRAILRCLLRTRHILAHDEQRYLLNRLYVDSYCTWIQSNVAVPERLLKAFSNKIIAQCRQSLLDPLSVKCGAITVQQLHDDAKILAEMSDDDDTDNFEAQMQTSVIEERSESEDDAESESGTSSDEDSDDEDIEDEDIERNGVVPLKTKASENGHTVQNEDNAHLMTLANEISSKLSIQLSIATEQQQQPQQQQQQKQQQDSGQTTTKVEIIQEKDDSKEEDTDTLMRVVSTRRL